MRNKKTDTKKKKISTARNSMSSSTQSRTKGSVGGKKNLSILVFWWNGLLTNTGSQGWSKHNKTH